MDDNTDRTTVSQAVKASADLVGLHRSELDSRARLGIPTAPIFDEAAEAGTGKLGRTERKTVEHVWE